MNNNTTLIALVIAFLVLPAVLGVNFTAIALLATALWIVYDLFNGARGGPTKYWRGQAIESSTRFDMQRIGPRLLFAAVLVAIVALPFLPPLAIRPTVLALLLICGVACLLFGWQHWNAGVIDMSSSKYWRGQRIDTIPRRRALPPTTQMLKTAMLVIPGVLMIVSAILSLVETGI